ncbi:hypothetical protein G6N73_33020 [Mesorhizobium camelthorni]|uniref:Guanylate cyclase domain-containing protein n=2 Tax=Allomesorhizobium camelthorni TaxID=475069 RepID=A0A6G4WLY9_9HYPH|nr:hypothetical protein [Mesorhizobium camelthorni]
MFVDITNSTARVCTYDGPQAIALAMKNIQQTLRESGGEIFSVAGDGLGAFFPSPSVACRAALSLGAWRTGLDGSNLGIDYRIGIHVGEVKEIEGGFYGASIHVAARLEQATSPNSVLISSAIAEAIRSDPTFRMTSIGPHLLRGFEQAVELYILHDPSNRPANKLVRELRSRLAQVSQPITPTIAVLPFEILAAEERWRLFAGAFTNELTSLLSRFRMLSVIASDSSKRFGSGEIGYNEAGRSLGSRFLVQGSIQADSDRLKLFAQLVDTASSKVIWSEKYDRVVGDLFTLQDELCECIAARLAVRVETAELERIRSQRPDSLQTYELLLRGHEHYYLHDKKSNKIARQFYKRATARDPSFARAYAFLSKTFNLEWRYRWSLDPGTSLAKARELAVQAIRIDGYEPRGHSELGFAELYGGNIAGSIASYERALELNPNDADVIAEYGDSLTYDGRPQEALMQFATAKRLNPVEPDWYKWCEGGALFQSGRYREAVGVLQNMRDPSEAARLLAASYAYLDDQARARSWASSVKQKHPQFSVDYWAETQPFRKMEDLDHFTKGLRLAGLN